eukprot:gene18889-25447_t
MRDLKKPGEAYVAFSRAVDIENVFILPKGIVLTPDMFTPHIPNDFFEDVDPRMTRKQARAWKESGLDMESYIALFVNGVKHIEEKASGSRCTSNGKATHKQLQWLNQLGVRREERDAMTYQEASDYITAEKANQTQFKLAHNNMNAVSGNQKDLAEKHQLDISACVTFNDIKLALEEADLTQAEESKPATPGQLRYLETLKYEGSPVLTMAEAATTIDALKAAKNNITELQVQLIMKKNTDLGEAVVRRMTKAVAITLIRTYLNAEAKMKLKKFYRAKSYEIMSEQEDAKPNRIYNLNASDFVLLVLVAIVLLYILPKKLVKAVRALVATAPSPQNSNKGL